MLNYFVLLIVSIELVASMKMDMCRTKPPVMENFDLLRLKGRWYEYARLPNLYQDLNGERCNTLNMETEGMDIRFMASFINETSGGKVAYEGNMSTDALKPGKVLVNLPLVGLTEYFNVLDAQYDEYVVLYFCDTLWYFKIELVWVLTREPHLSEGNKKLLIDRLKVLNVATDRLEFENQNNC